jgi:hypothetical protein
MVGQTFRSVRASSRTRFRVTESARHEREPVVVDVGRGIRLSASSQTLQFSTTATRSNTLTSHCRKSNELADRFVSWIVAEQCHASVGGPIFSVPNFPSGTPGQACVRTSRANSTLICARSMTGDAVHRSRHPGRPGDSVALGDSRQAVASAPARGEDS